MFSLRNKKIIFELSSILLSGALTPQVVNSYIKCLHQNIACGLFVNSCFIILGCLQVKKNAYAFFHLFETL